MPSRQSISHVFNKVLLPSFAAIAFSIVYLMSKIQVTSLVFLASIKVVIFNRLAIIWF